MAQITYHFAFRKQQETNFYIFQWQPKARLLRSYFCRAEFQTVRISQQNEIVNGIFTC